MSVADDIIKEIRKWINKNIELFPIFIGYIYSMNIDPIIIQVSEKVRNIDIIEFKQSLLNIRRMIYSSSMPDVENPVIQDVLRIDRYKYEICSKIQDEYCSKYIRYLVECEKKVDEKYLKYLAIILRVFDRQKLLNNSIIRVSMREDVLKGWIRGVLDSLRDLGYNLDDSYIKDILGMTIRDIVDRSIPIGYASLNVLIIPSCLEDYCNYIANKYGNIKYLLSLT